MFFSVIGAIFKDIPNFINMFLSVAMFFMPVVYPLPDSGIIYQLNIYNPLYYLIDVPRSLFLRAGLFMPKRLLYQPFFPLSSFWQAGDFIMWQLPV